MHDLSGGGVERMRLTLIAALRARDFDVTLVVSVKQGALVPSLPSDLSVVELGVWRTSLAVPKLAMLLRRARPDVLVSSLDHNNIAALLALRMSGSAARLVICQHNALSREGGLGWKYRVVPWAYRFLHHAAHGIVAVSEGVAQDLAQAAAIPREKMTVIYNPVIDAGFSARAAGGVPHPWLSGKDRPVFVFVGRLTAQKDVPTLLMAMAILLRQRPARLILVGEGEDELELHRLARKQGIAHAIAFAGFQANPLPWIKHADALVSSSRYEGLGNTIVEALACGTQVIATDCPYGPSEVLLQGALGQLVPVGDASALAEAMAKYDMFHCAPTLMMQRAQSFTAGVCAEAHVKLFERIVMRDRAPVHALGMKLSPLCVDEVVEMIIGDVSRDCVNLVVTPNLDHVRRLRNPAFAAAYASARLACPDGLPVLLYARLRGLRLRGRVTGCDVFARLFRHNRLVGKRIFLVVESGATALAAFHWATSLGIAGTMDIAVAPLQLDVDIAAQLALAQRIRAAVPDILVMTLGAPVSEIFVHRHRSVLPPCWALCVGQALRVELSLVRRAPAFWQALGAEWLWRLCHEPRRLLRRYVQSLIWFPVAIWRDLLGHLGKLGS